MFRTSASRARARTFWQAAVRSLELDVRYDAHALAAVPKTGPVVFVANHPYGVLDGIVMSWLVSKVRPDFLVLTHIVLTRAPEAAPFHPADRFLGRRGRRANEPRFARGGARPSRERRRRCGVSRPARFRRRPTSLASSPQSTVAGSRSCRSSSSVRRRPSCRSGLAARTAAYSRSRAM